MLAPGSAVVARRAPAAADPEAGAWAASWRAAAAVWLTLRAAYGVVTVLHRALTPGGPGTALDNWLQWDGWSYAAIADAGYDGLQRAAFFPLYPLLARAADVILPGGAPFALLVVSNVCTLGALVLLHRLVDLEAGAAVADRTLWLLGVFPTAYFLAAPYNHSLFLLLVLGFLYSIRRQRWWLAAALGALASGTRSAGVFLVLPFAYEYLRLRRFQLRQVRPDAVAMALIPAGLAAYAWYCWSRFGDPLAFSHAQSFWQKRLSWPGYTLWEALRQLGERSLMENFSLIGDLAGLAFTVALLAACVWGPWALRRDQLYLVVYALPVVLLPLFYPLGQANPISGTARYVLDIAVLFLVLGRAVSRPTVERAYVILAVTTQVGLLLLYLRGDWTF